MATRCTTAFVDPPRASATVAALRTEASEMILLGGLCFSAISTLIRPVSAARREWFAETAGTEDAPGSVKPSVSAMAVIVEAVPMVMQCPCVLAIPPSMPFQSHSEILPARRSSQYFQASEPEPSTSPFQQPLIIGPAGKKIEGISALMAPISVPGVVLSQPPINTAPSTG